MDYSKIGFKCGLEIHQQLETHKLFCKCPSLVNDESTPNLIFKRKLRASESELGKKDIAAEYEQQKQKTFVYEACSTSSCLVEQDEEPPQNLNQDALDTALMVAKLLNMTIINELHFMRKVVVDGSNTSAFQRTALVGMDGYIETSQGKVGIKGLFLEEEASKRIKTTDQETTYRLDRLGVPLLEIATEADIKDPEHAKEAAEIIGMILRSTNRVKRGLGTIRQDVNISIKDSERTEIKGFQDLRSIPKVINFEIERQQNLIKQGEKLEKEVRKANPDFTTTFLRPMPTSSRMYPETDIPPIRITESMLELIKAPKLITEQALELEKTYKLQPAISQELIKAGIDFTAYTKTYDKIEPKLLAQILIEYPKDIKSRLKLNIENITEENYKEILTAINESKINKDAVFELLTDAANKKELNFNKFKTASSKDIEKEIIQTIKQNQGAPFNALMGILMGKYKGRVDGSELARILKENL